MSTIRESVSKLVPLLERLSLLRINDAALERVIRTVEFSSSILDVNTDQNTKPMISPTEEQCVYMRSDEAAETDRKTTMCNASHTVEGYFVTPSQHKHYSDL